MRYLSLLLIALVVACGPSEKKDELKALKDEVMTIHDEVMPKMGELRKTRMALEAMADSVMATDSTNAQMYSKLAADISNANEGMMQWMRAFELDYEGTDEEVKTYMEEQKVAIEKVRDDMNNSLAKGKEVLDQY